MELIWLELVLPSFAKVISLFACLSLTESLKGCAMCVNSVPLSLCDTSGLLRGLPGSVFGFTLEPSPSLRAETSLNPITYLLTGVAAPELTV